MFICSLTVLFLALQNSSGLKIYPSDVPGCPGAGYVARKTFLEEHNKRRASLAKGELQIGETKLPAAANMLFMAYNCNLEAEASKLTECETASETETPRFDKTKTNFAIIKSRLDNGEISAPREAASQWWNESSHWHNRQELTMKSNSTIPFFLMAQAEGDTVGCSVRTCRKDGATYYPVACVYGKKVQVGSELYIEGSSLNCPEDYKPNKDALCKKPKQQ